jgi:hypothetical protein
LAATGNISGGNVSGTNLVGTLLTAAQPNITSVGALTAPAITVTGNVTGGNIITSGQVIALGNVVGDFFIGNGSQLTGIDATSIQNGSANVRTFENANVAVSADGIANVLVITGTGANIAGTLNATGNASVGNLDTTTVVATTLTGTLSTADQPNITSVGTLSELTVTGNVNGGNLITAGVVQTSNLIVDGIESVGTLNVSGDTLISGNLTVSGTTFTANVQSLVISDPVLGLGSGANGNSLTSNDGLDRGVKMFYFTDAEQIAFMGYDNSEGKMLFATNVSVANDIVTVNSLGTAVVGTLESTVVTATGNITGENLKTASVTIGDGPISGVTTFSASGNATVGNIGAVSGEFTGDITAGATVTATGNITGGNLITAGFISATGQITGSQFNGSGAGLDNIPGANVTGTLSINTTGSAASLTTARLINGTSFDGTANITTANWGTARNITIGSTTRSVDGSTTYSWTLDDIGAYANTNPAGYTTNTGTVTSIATANGVAGGTITTTGTIELTGQALALHNLATNGIIVRTGSGTVAARSIASGTGVTVTNGDGVSGNPSIAIGQAVATTSTPTFAGITLPSITKSGSNAIGNIGQNDNRFDTIFARATSASYADLAELYTADQDYPPGTVLIFSGAQEVTVSKNSNDTRIAGVVSTHPAHVMNSTLESQHTAAVALVGRVPCQVVGTVRKGDCLVSSNIPGVAQALVNGMYQPGVVIGKALEEYNSDKPGTIEVVVGRL